MDLAGRLRLDIVHGELAPGQRLVELDLAAWYGSSRGAVRDALAVLAHEGLVERERNRGARVRPVSLAEAIEITEVRMVLEGLCAAKAAAAATREERAGLRDVGRSIGAAVKTGDVVAYSAACQQVHTRVREIAAQTTITGVLDRLRYQSVRYQFRVALLPGRPAQGLKEHLAVVRAVAAGDADAAEETMRAHLRSVIDALHRLGDPTAPGGPGAGRHGALH
jgi:DNA-binding GntR family transcriptional regulator